jgi:hypothetical protein
MHAVVEVYDRSSGMLINRETGKIYSDLEENHPQKGCIVDNGADDCLEHLIDHHHDHPFQIDNCYEKTKKKADGRLFHEYPLYCEGHPKPICRGVLHLVRLLSSSSH